MTIKAFKTYEEKMLDQGVIIEDRAPYHWNEKPSVSPIKSRELDRADSPDNHSIPPQK
jgi:hypothetical protein